MPIDIKVPTVGESITTGVLGAWRKKSGEYVRSGDVLFEIETDKVTSEVYAEADGLLKHLVEQGAEVKVGQVVANIDETAPAPAAEEKPAEAKPAAEAKAPAPAAAPASAPAPKAAEGKDIPLSPAVRRVISETGANPAEIPGSGKGGRILKSDAVGFSPKAPAGPRTNRKKMTPLRRKIADRLVSSQQETASLTTFNEINMSNIMALRSRFQDRFVEKHGLKLGFMSLFLKATVYALGRVPAINAQISGDEIVENNFFDIGVAISTEKGLMVPVIRDVDKLSLAGIEQAIADYAKKARAGKITIPDLEGGVFSVTNGGTFGSLLSTPIINPPQSAILGMHSINERPIAVNGQVQIHPMMYVALTYDHRLVDGKQAVTFLVALKEFIEQPGVALLDF